MGGSGGLTRRAVVGAAVAGSVGLACPAVGQGGGRTLRFKPAFDLATLDQVAAPSHESGNSSFMAFDTLYGIDDALVARPQMAEGHEVSDDGLTWRFRLRDGLLFHDGEPVRAQDAVASIARWSQREALGQVLRRRTAEMRAVSDRVLEIRLNKAFPQMLFALGRNTLFVLPERVAAGTSPSTPIKEYIGSGPFVFLKDEWQAGAHAAFRRNERYVPRPEPPSLYAGGKVVNFDRVEWITIPDPATASSALQRGEIDWWEWAPADLLPRLRRTAGVAVAKADRFGWFGQIPFNTTVPPFDNPRLRHALLYAVDQTECMQAVVGDEPDMMATGVGLFPPGTPLATGAGLEILTGPRDLELARRKVRESGYAGKRVGFMVATDGFAANAFGTVMTERFRQAGINVDHIAVDLATLVSRRNQPTSGAWHCYTVSSDGILYSTPGTHLRLLATTPDPRFVALRDAWYDAPDLGAQRKVAEALQLAFLEAPSFLPLGQYFQTQAHRTGVSGIIPAPQTVFWGARKG